MSRYWLLALVVVALLAAGWIALTDPAVTRVIIEQRFSAPSARHWFGTDELGRDVFARTLAGAAYSGGLVALALGGAVCFGLAAGGLHGLVNNPAFTRCVDVVVNVAWSLPGLVFFMAVTTYAGRGFWVVVGAMAVVSWVPIARVVRLEVARDKRSAYVTTLRSLGYGERRVFSAMLANVRAPVLVTALTVAVDLVAAESGLSFLGLGIQPPDPSLGSMIYTGIYYASAGWWMAAFPLAALVGLMVGLKWISSRASLGILKAE